MLHETLTRPFPAQVVYWHKYHFGVAPKEFLRETAKATLIRSKAMEYAYSVEEGRIKRRKTAP